MAKRGLYLLIRTDCEATGHSIGDAGLGEWAVRGLLEILESRELLGTFYVVPGDLEAGASLYRQVRQAGHEVSLHMHPADMGYEEFLGIYGPDQQREILGQGIKRFEAVMGYKPKGFSAGYASANDYTFGVLEELGFTNGVVSVPTRVLPECASVWAGAPLGMHYANAWNRILPGGLNFVEIPHTLDPDSRMWGGKHPQDLRVELVDAKNHWYTIAKAIDRQLADDKAVVRYISACTHNTLDYSDPGNFRRQTLERIIEHVKGIADSKGLEVLPATSEQLADEFRRRVPRDQSGGVKLGLDTRGRG